MALAGRLDFNPVTDTLTTADGEEVQLDEPVGDHPPRGRLRPRRGHLRGPARRQLRRRGGGVAHVRPPPAARALPALGRQRLRRAAAPAQGPRQVHHRPHLHGRPVAQVPRPPREHLGQPVRRRDQRLHRRPTAPARTRSTARPGPIPDIASTYTRPGMSWVAVGDENYGEGSVPRARRHGAPLPRRQGDPRPQLRPHPRDQPQEAGRAARSPSPTRPSTTRSRRTTSCRSSAWPTSRPASPCTCEIVKPDGTTVAFEGSTP